MEIPTQREDIKALQGVHIFHFPISNCSQRVRIAASEKGIAWISHIVDLTRDEHTTPEYLRLNPKGLVPVLVHDGRTHVESNDIIKYLDETFPGARLHPDSAADLAFVEQSIASSSGAQSAMKLLSHEFLFKPKALKSPEKLRAFETTDADPALVDFHREFTAGKGFSAERIQAAISDIGDRFCQLETRLGDTEWLSGPAYGLADISWLVNAYRLRLMDYPFERFPRMKSWLSRAMARPSFKTGIRNFEPASARLAFAGYTAMRKFRGNSIRHYSAADHDSVAGPHR